MKLFKKLFGNLNDGNKKAGLRRLFYSSQEAMLTYARLRQQEPVQQQEPEPERLQRQQEQKLLQELGQQQEPAQEPVQQQELGQQQEH